MCAVVVETMKRAAWSLNCCIFYPFPLLSQPFPLHFNPNAILNPRDFAFILTKYCRLKIFADKNNLLHFACICPEFDYLYNYYSICSLLMTILWIYRMVSETIIRKFPKIHNQTIQSSPIKLREFHQNQSCPISILWHRKKFLQPRSD